MALWKSPLRISLIARLTCCGPRGLLKMKMPATIQPRARAQKKPRQMRENDGRDQSRQRSRHDDGQPAPAFLARQPAQQQIARARHENQQQQALRRRRPRQLRQNAKRQAGQAGQRQQRPGRLGSGWGPRKIRKRLIMAAVRQCESRRGA